MSNELSASIAGRFGRRDALRIGGLSVSLAALVAACGDDRGGSTDPGRINWTGGFIYRIAVTVALPLILLVASLFPEIGGSLTSLLEPLQKALP